MPSGPGLIQRMTFNQWVHQRLDVLSEEISQFVNRILLERLGNRIQTQTYHQPAIGRLCISIALHLPQLRAKCSQVVLNSLQPCPCPTRFRILGQQ